MNSLPAPSSHPSISSARPFVRIRITPAFPFSQETMKVLSFYFYNNICLLWLWHSFVMQFRNYTFAFYFVFFFYGSSFITYFFYSATSLRCNKGRVLLRDERSWNICKSSLLFLFHHC